MNKSRTTPRFSRHTQGAALIICLIILLVASFIATRGATTADLQISMARVEQYGLYVFDLARSELKAQFKTIEGDQTEIVVVLNLPEDQAKDVSHLHEMQPGAAYDQEIYYTYRGERTVPPGFSVDKYTGHHFTVRSVANVSQTTTQSDQTLGLTYLAPENN